MKNPYVQIIDHPDDVEIPVDYEALVRAAKDNHVLLERNSDAHCENDVGNHSRSKSMLEEISFPEELVVNRSLEAAAEYIPFLRRMLDGKLDPREAAI